MDRTRTVAILVASADLFISGCAPENSHTDSARYNWSGSDAVDNAMSTETAPEAARLPKLTCEQRYERCRPMI